MASFASILRYSSLIAGFAVLNASALAQGTDDQRSACMADAFKFCTADIPNVTAIEACLLRNVSQLSPPCQAEFHPVTRKTKLKPDHFPPPARRS